MSQCRAVLIVLFFRDKKCLSLINILYLKNILNSTSDGKLIKFMSSKKYSPFQNNNKDNETDIQFIWIEIKCLSSSARHGTHSPSPSLTGVEKVISLSLSIFYS